MRPELVGQQPLLVRAVPCEARAEGADARDVYLQWAPGVQGDAEALAERGEILPPVVLLWESPASAIARFAASRVAVGFVSRHTVDPGGKSS